MWLPETLLMLALADSRSMPLGGIQLRPSWIDNMRQALGLLWPLASTTIGIKTSERTPLVNSAAASILAFIPAGALNFLLIR